MHLFTKLPKPLLGLIKLCRLEEFYGNTIALIALGAVFAPRLSALDIALLFAANLLLTVFAFAINDVEDAEDDARDPRKAARNPVSARLLGRTAAVAASWLSALAGLGLLLRFGPWVVLLGCINIALGFAYSVKRVRLKALPFVDLISHGLFLGTLQFLTTVRAGAPAVPVAAVLGACLICAVSMTGDLWNEIRDYDVDRQTGIRNTASVLDVRRIEPLLPHMFAWPSAGILLLVAISLSGTQRVVALLLALACGVVFALLPARAKKRLVTDQAQLAAALGGLLLLVMLRAAPLAG
ncbi:UbiA family prenyltransferase [Sorangium sp. So ce1389]|uniref:UbiA family prenyltransferase n=1 Tax=Sorangium sp. So ce1389 TaxID=3133336 RepID=UPI003F5F678A